MHIPAVEEWERLSPALVRPPTFPADLPFVPGFAAEYGTTPTGACCRWMIPVPSYDAAGLKDAVAAAADHPAGFFKAIQAPRSVATIAKAAMMLLADDAAKAGWARVTIPETEWPGMVERRGFTRENRFLEIWAVIFGPEPVILVTTGQQDTEAAAP